MTKTTLSADSMIYIKLCYETIILVLFGWSYYCYCPYFDVVLTEAIETMQAGIFLL